MSNLLKGGLVLLGGIVLLGMGSAGLKSAYAPGKNALQSYDEASGWGSFVVFGVLLTIIGVLWLVVELKAKRRAAEESRLPPAENCVTCGFPKVFKRERAQWYCPSCKAYSPATVAVQGQGVA